MTAMVSVACRGRGEQIGRERPGYNRDVVEDLRFAIGAFRGAPLLARELEPARKRNRTSIRFRCESSPQLGQCPHR